MRKMRYIPMFALTALLTGCSLFGDKIKAPTFAKEGDEVSYSEFTKVLQEAIQNGEVADTEALLGDRVVKSKSSYTNTNSWKRGKKDVSKYQRQLTSTGEYNFDYDNIAAKMTGELKQSEKGNDQEETSSTTSTQKIEYYYQVETIRNTKSMVQANAKTNKYTVVSTFPSSYNSEDALDDLLRQNYNSIYSQFSYSIPSSSVAKDYMFFINGNDTLFTFSQTSDDEDQQSAYSVVTRIRYKAQLDLTDKKQALRISQEEKIEYTYKRDYESYQEGDVVVEETKNYTEVTFAAKSTTVKQVDISDYTQYSY